MMRPVLRIVIVLYRTRLSAVRRVLDRLKQSAIDASMIVTVCINKEGLDRDRGLRRTVRVCDRILLDVRVRDNSSGVTGAYNQVIADGQPHDVMVILDGDSDLPADYFAEIWRRRTWLLSGLSFVSAQMRAADLRVSPYRLRGITPIAIEGDLDLGAGLAFAEGIGVINSGLAGSIGSFREINGFSERISLDLSDVAWSIEAGRKGAALTLLTDSQAHNLSMLSGGFNFPRLRKYLVACWRLARQARDARGYIRLSLRGLRALRWVRRSG